VTGPVTTTGRPAAGAGAGLVVRGLTKRFGGVTAVDDASLECAPGEILVLMGPNGAGKSTLFGLISGFLRADAGTVHLDGKQINRMRPDRICALGLSRTFQITEDFGTLTVRQTLLSALHLRGGGSLAQRCEDLGARFGLDHVLDRSAESLNVADRKRLELARAYATGPRYLLLDEVGAGLTPREISGLATLIRDINGEGIAVIFVEHVMQLVRALADRVVVLDHGKVIATSAFHDIVNDQRVVNAYLGTRGHRAGA